MAGEGAANPWAEFGKPADGAPAGEPKPGEKPADVKPGEETVQLTKAQYDQITGSLKAAQDKIAKLPDNFEGMSDKIKIVDRLVKALGGEEVDKNKQAYSA